LQDVAIFGRIFEAMPARQGDPLWLQVADAVAVAMAQAADKSNAADGPAALAACLQSASTGSLQHAEPTGEPTHELPLLLTAPIALLSDDMRLLTRAL
jgi:hypothetical protein